MAVTDLTGTKWLFNETLSILENSSYELNFISNSETYAGISFVFMTNPPPNPPLVQLLYVGSISTLEAFSNSLPGWSNESYRTISITGGTDTTNAILIAWLQSTATQIQDESNPISVGNLPIANMYFGTQQVKKVYLGNALVWEKATQSFSTIHLCGVYETDGYTDYAINSSSPQTISRANNASVSRTNMTFALAQQYSLTLSDVSSLKIRYFDDYKIYAPDGSVIADWGSTMPSSIDSDNFYEFISALSEGCYVCVYYND